MNALTETCPAEVATTAPATDSTSLLNIIAAAAENPNVSVEKMAGLLDLQERVLAKQAEAEFNRAYAAMLLDLPRIKKNGTVEYPVDKNKPEGPKAKAFNFARWEDIDAIVRPIMIRHGFSLSFDSGMREGGGVLVVGKLRHAAGHVQPATVPLAVDASGGKNNLQGIGSSISYGKRYATQMLLNLVFEGEDDDGVKGGTVYIDEAEIEQVNRLIGEAKADVNGFCDFMGVENVPAIHKKDLAKALNALTRKKQQTQGAKA